MIRKASSLALGAVVVIAGLGWNGEPEALVTGDWFATAQAIPGRPLTPVSYAGVARRTTRRAVVATSAATAATVAPTTVVVAAPPSGGCTTVVDSAGNTVQRCP